MLPTWLIGEFVGTFLIVFFGCGSVCASLTMSALVGNFQIAVVWGLGIALAIHLTGALSGAHLNPSVTLSCAVWNRFPWRRVVPYMGTQWLGAFFAAVVLYGLFGDSLRAYEQSHGIVRGKTGSEASAMVFGEFYPSPGGQPFTDTVRAKVTPFVAFLAECTGTALLLIAIGGLTDRSNPKHSRHLTPLLIGLTVTLLIALFGPLSMACFNPARDLGPRVFSSLAGWGSVPFTTNGWGWLTVYIVAPLLGGVIGGGIDAMLLKPADRTGAKIENAPAKNARGKIRDRDAEVIAR